MHPPRQSTRSIPVLPSIYTSFPTDSNPSSRNTSANDSTSTCVEDGIELVPIERSNSTCGKILSPGTEEKEVISSAEFPHASTKSLPDLPRGRWGKSPKSSCGRCPIKCRILVLFAVKTSILLIILSCLLSIQGRKAHGSKAEMQPDNPEAPPIPNIRIKQGTFAVALSNARKQSSACLERNNESAAWACTTDDILRVNVLPSGQPGQNLISIEPSSNIDWTSYGQRPLSISPTILTPAKDSELPDNGPGYHFRTTYDRMVLIKDDSLPIVNAASNRMGTGHSAIQEGDQPWLCYFNETVVEGYIYVSRRSVSTNKSISSLSANSTKMSDIPFLPYTFKITEERISNSTMPYCELQMISKDKKLVSNGTNTLILALSEPIFVSDDVQMDRNLRKGQRKREQTSTGKSCQCEWVVQ
ncbi:hypothetical protein P280DRAFT_11533 [Massarina eburnea CBS 473.64]|uniref:DUF7820 domain-containing protein n=1 Tax=Massarina eburnea CBS 473.64 TaxID=1395130 RepID=A0A6A6SF28_9PLEO|nr:hypothetical protein P280DRAFT_11533 [Massarina eburnea CBS 473.64]